MNGRQVHRKEVSIGVPFLAPAQVTFGWQHRRRAFSVWFVEGDIEISRYVVLPTGHDATDAVQLHIVNSCVVDGHEVYHLCLVYPT